MATEGNEVKDEHLDTHEEGGDDEVRSKLPSSDRLTCAMSIHHAMVDSHGYSVLS